ncbi:IS3 family transposase [Tissierella sp. MB52-C2]|uniref:IS3 family transposase n=1 Tax=Tissierella sp. MB52-C2 TaxID=3070999 RepID=UPI0035ABE14E
MPSIKYLFYIFCHILHEALKEYITDIHNQFKMCYGYRRVKIELDARGIKECTG